MAEHPQPEMTRLSLQDLALRIKIMKIGNGAIEETLLKALDPPLTVNIQRAVSSLIEVRCNHLSLPSLATLTRIPLIG